MPNELHRAWVAAALAAVVACSPRPAVDRTDSTTAPAATTPPAVPESTPPGSPVATPPATSPPPTTPPAITPAVTPPGTARTGGPLSPRAVRDSGGLVGTTVRVRGRCLPLSATAAEGSPPATRSDWQLEGDGAAIFVVGPRPAACSPTTGSEGEVEVAGQVAQDTLRALGSKGPRPRRFLVASK